MRAEAKAKMTAIVHTATRAVTVDLSCPISLALELDFAGGHSGRGASGLATAPMPTRAQPRHFDAPAATSRPYAVPGFSGSVATGASCNCDVITVIPHCNGTHTEGVGHLTREPFDAYRLVPAGLTEALLLTVAPTAAAREPGESTEPAPRAGDRLITRRALETAWAPYADRANTAPLALVIRTRHEARTRRDAEPSTSSAVPDRARDHNSATPDRSHGAAAPAPYLTREAALLLVERGIEHLVIDLPSIDREHDEGRLTAHRIFFGLPANSRELDQATRRQATVTEFADIPDALADGSYLLAIQVPAWRGDAVPSRPLLYPIQQ